MKREDDGWYSRSSDPPLKLPGTSPVKVYPTGGSDIVIPAPKGSLLARQLRGGKAELLGERTRVVGVLRRRMEVARQREFSAALLTSLCHKVHSGPIEPYKGGFQEGDRIRLYASCTCTEAQRLTVNVFLKFTTLQNGASHYYFEGGFHQERRSVKTFDIYAGYTDLRVPLCDIYIPLDDGIVEFGSAANLEVQAEFEEEGGGLLCDSIIYIDITPGASSFTGILTGDGVIDPANLSGLNPDGGNPIQGFGEAREKHLPVTHWIAKGPWNPWEGADPEDPYSTGLDDYGFYNTHTPERKPAVEVRLRSAFFDNSDFNELMRNDAWFHFRIKLPGGVALTEDAPLRIILKLSQNGKGSYWINGLWPCYDWSYFRPLVRFIPATADGEDISASFRQWTRVEGRGLDDYSFQFEITAKASRSDRYIEVAQSFPYPPSRIWQKLDKWSENIQCTTLKIGVGGLSLDPVNPETNTIPAFWVRKASPFNGSHKPVMMILMPELEPTAHYVAEGMVEALLEHPEYLESAQYLFFFMNNPDGMKWGMVKNYPYSGNQPMNWWWDVEIHESFILSEYVRGLRAAGAGLELRTYLELHCDLAPRVHDYTRMPIYGGYAADDPAVQEVEDFISDLKDDPTFGKYYRSQWRRHDTDYFRPLLDPQRYGFRHFIQVEFPEIALYSEEEENAVRRRPMINGYNYEYIEGDPGRLIDLGRAFMHSVYKILAPQ